MWSNDQLTPEEINRVKYIDQQDDVKHAHYKHLNAYLHEQIQFVANEQMLGDNGRDHIDVNTMKYPKLSTCAPDAESM